MYRYVFVGLLVAVTAFAVLAETQSVPLVNPNFDEGLTGWDYTIVSTPAEAGIGEGPGGPCLYVLGEEGSRTKVLQRVPVNPNRWYKITFRYRAVPNGSGGGCLGNFRGNVWDQKGKFVDYPCGIALFDTFDEWKTAETMFKAPLCTGDIGLEFNASGACDIRIDEVALFEVEPPAPEPNTWARYVVERPEQQWFSSWEYLNQAGHFRKMAMKYGWRYVYREQYEGLLESRTTPLWRGEDVYRLYTEMGIPACVYLHYPAMAKYQAFYDSKPPADVPRFIDPAWHDAYVEACVEACQAYGEEPGIAYFFVVDEAFKQYRDGIVPKAERESPFWDALEAEVRERFGNGTYGLPDDKDDPDPFKWIAYCSWAADDLSATFARLRAVIDASDCGAKLLGPDEFATLVPLHWCDLAPSVDVFTGQSLSTCLGSGRYDAGFLTKCAADFTGKAVHNATQVPLYGGSPSPEEVQRQYSEVLQNGGDGQMLIGVEWHDRELNHHKYSAPARWESIKNSLKQQSKYAVQTPSYSAAGILFSSPSQMVRCMRLSDSELQTAYAFCGPVLGAWPRMLDSYAVSKEKASFDGLSVVIVPHAPYEHRVVYDALMHFAEQGGLVVVLDPQAFQFDTHGEAFEREAFLGLNFVDTEPQRLLETSWPAEMRLRVCDRTCYKLIPANEEEVVATYEDGSAAAVLHSVGEGHVLTFGTNPVTDRNSIADGQWQAFWKGLLAERNVPLNLDIWQLRLPDEGVVQAQAPGDVCITGNNFVRVQNGVFLGANRPADGYYTLSAAPDLSPESAKGERILFGEGDLTDRTSADDGPFEMPRREAKEPYKEADWANRWSADALADGLTITFTFGEVQNLSRVRFWISGAMPELTLAGFAANTEIATAQVPAQDAGEDVLDIDVELTGEADRVELRFAPGTAPFALADIEIWAER